MSEINQAAYEQTQKLTSASAGAGADFVLSNQSSKDRKMTLTQLATFMAANLGAISATSVTVTTLSATNVNISNDTTIAEAGNIITGTTTGTQIGTASGQKVGFFGVTPVVKGAVLTVADAVALDATYNVTEQTTVSNMRVRINEIETRLQAFGFLN